eukprot:7391494-Prymnesium_polylepis.2
MPGGTLAASSAVAVVRSSRALITSAFTPSLAILIRHLTSPGTTRVGFCTTCRGCGESGVRAVGSIGVSTCDWAISSPLGPVVLLTAMPWIVLDQ